jgi:hypothetical protein
VKQFTSRDFLFAGTRTGLWELFCNGIFAMRSGTVMSQQLSTWQTATGQTYWLSRLIDAMEKFSRAEWRAHPVDPRELQAIRARLAQPALLHPAYGSRFSLRN